MSSDMYCIYLNYKKMIQLLKAAQLAHWRDCLANLPKYLIKTEVS